jgi:hypothetical protein
MKSAAKNRWWLIGLKTQTLWLPRRFETQHSREGESVAPAYAERIAHVWNVAVLSDSCWFGNFVRHHATISGSNERVRN